MRDNQNGSGSTVADWIIGALAVAILLSVQSCMDSREEQIRKEEIAFRNGITEGAKQQALKQMKVSASNECTWERLLQPGNGQRHAGIPGGNQAPTVNEKE